MKEIPPPAPLLVFTPSKIQEDTEVELLEKSKDAEEIKSNPKILCNIVWIQNKKSLKGGCGARLDKGQT